MSETHTATSGPRAAGRDRAVRLARLRRSSLGVVVMLIVQFILGMPGNKAKGIAMLKTCAEKGTYATVPARVSQSRSR